jgi:tryptophanyl-tRNA synthetase
MSDRRKQVLSCTQPTGNLHFGRYFGAVKNWVDLQADYDCVYGVVDLHAMTMPYKIDKLRNQTWELIFNLIATGIDPDNLFVQSLIPEHAELNWIFNTITPYGELSRMTQFKDKSQQVNEGGKEALISSALFTYPVLQAADILIYNADFVPVGKDQEQHLELTRNIAQRFNHIVGKEYFVMPATLHTEVPKVLSTADPKMKMSASKGEKHNIDIFAEPAKIRKQIKSAVTDAGDVKSPDMSPGVSNLFLLLKAAGNQSSYDSLMDTYVAGNLRYGDLKHEVAEALVELTDPFRAKKAEILQDKRTYKDRVKASSEVIRVTASKTLKEVKDLVGLLNVK